MAYARKTGGSLGPKQKRRRGSNLPYVIAAIVAVAVLIGAVVLQNQTRAETAIVPDTLCPQATGPLAYTAILFDLTDPLSAVQGQKLLQYMEREFAQAAIGTQFTMGTVSDVASNRHVTPPLCKPRSGGDVSGLTQNVQMVQQRYDERFLRPLEANLHGMIGANGADSSPIMEALQALVATSPGFLVTDKPRKLIIVSDLLQHSDAMSFYQGDSWKSFAASSAFQNLGPVLSDVTVEIYGIPRAAARIRDPAVVEDFWLRYFEHQGARLPRMQKLGDL